ncbi:MAG: hypothetical protein V3T53_02510 [Phycisphaerales bacterium]
MSFARSLYHTTLPALMLGFVLFAGGCVTSYITPGAAADLSTFGLTNELRESMTDTNIRSVLARKPLATFPVHLAVARVQSPGYYSYSTRGYGHGKYSVITDRDFETDDDIAKLRALPEITDVVAINRLLLPANLTSDRELRAAAAAVHADMILIYTVDTRFTTDKVLQPLGALTLGLFPNETANVRSTMSAVLIDTRNGYLCAAAEASAKQSALTNAWSNRSTVERSRRKTERESFEKLLADFTRAWPQVVRTYHTASH